MRLKRTLAIIGATLTLTGVASAANASTTHHPVTKADKRALHVANTECAPITDDVTWEACVIGDVQTLRVTRNKRTGHVTSARTFTDADYETGDVVKALHGTHSVSLKVRKVSKADKRAIRDANSECAYLLADDTTSDLWEACIVGMFTSDTGRVITLNDYHDVETYGPDGESVTGVRMVLDHGSHNVLK